MTALIRREVNPETGESLTPSGAPIVRADTGNPLADWIGDMIAHGLRCADCDVKIEADMPRSVCDDDRALCEECWLEHDPDERDLGPRPSVPVRKVIP